MLGPDQQRVVEAAGAEVRGKRQSPLPVLTRDQLIDSMRELGVEFVQARLTGGLLILSARCHDGALLPAHGQRPRVGLSAMRCAEESNENQTVRHR